MSDGRGTSCTASTHACEYDGVPAVRLSPVERRNLSLINDPALEGFSREGMARASSADGSASAKTPASAFSAEAVASAGSPAFVSVPARVSPVEAKSSERKFSQVEHELGCFRYMVRPNGTARLLSYEGSEAYVEIPPVAGGCRVSSLASGLFRGHAEIEQVVLPSTLEHMGDHVFDGCVALRHVDLPNGLASIGSFAFAKSGLESLSAPPTVERIGAKAFFSCKRLRLCELVDGLRELGDEAFAYSALSRMALPATLERMGRRVFEQTPAQQHAHSGSISVSSSNAHYRMDSKGGLYRGREFVELVGIGSAYCVSSGTLAVADAALCRNAHIRRVELPEGLRSIGANAFRGCRNLREVRLPDSLESIGDRAFLDTKLASVRLGARLRQVGDSALLVQGRSPLHASAALKLVEVSSENPLFYVESGLLCQRGAGAQGGDLCLLYVGPESVVRIPHEVNRIATCAFCGTSDVEELFVHDHMHSICWEAFSAARAIPRLHVALPQVEGVHESCTLDFVVPSLSARFRSVTNLITTSERGTEFNFALYDAWVAHAVAIEEFAPAAVARLARPVCLSERARELYLGILGRKQNAVCAFFARRGNMEALEALRSWDVLGSQATKAQLDQATREGDAQAAACLLELMRRSKWAIGVDLSL